MVAESGGELLERSARVALVERLLGRATVLTPNVPEARTLAASGGEVGPDVGRDGDGEASRRDGRGASSQSADPEALARAVHALGPRCVVVTGGHREHAIDVFFDGEALIEIPGQRYPDGASHGSGCTHSSVLAARLAWGDPPLQAARVAKQLAACAVAHGLVEIGAGAGPVDILGLRSRAASIHRC
jgi:hydroxymethylpyrimidine/phosphomethylpyrimidine kinase